MASIKSMFKYFVNKNKLNHEEVEVRIKAKKDIAKCILDESKVKVDIVKLERLTNKDLNGCLILSNYQQDKDILALIEALPIEFDIVVDLESIESMLVERIVATNQIGQVFKSNLVESANAITNAVNAVNKGYNVLICLDYNENNQVSISSLFPLFMKCLKPIIPIYVKDDNNYIKVVVGEAINLSHHSISGSLKLQKTVRQQFNTLSKE